MKNDLEKKLTSKINFEVFMRNRCAIEFVNTDLPSECVIAMSPLKFNFKKEKWEDIKIIFNDEIGADISNKIFLQLHMTSEICFKIKKLNSTGEEKEVFNISGYMTDFNLGGFSYRSSDLDRMGLEYNLPNEIKINIEVTKVVLE